MAGESSPLVKDRSSYGATSSESIDRTPPSFIGLMFGKTAAGSAVPDSVSEGVRNFLDGQSMYGKYFDGFVTAVILLNVACLIVHPDEYGTVIAWGTVAGRAVFFDTVEACSVALFTVEWVLRFAFATEDQGPRKAIVCGKPYIFSAFQREQLLGRMYFLLSFWSFIDLATIVPYYVDIMLPKVDLPSVQFIRVARLLRVFRPDGACVSALAPRLLPSLLPHPSPLRPSLPHRARFAALSASRQRRGAALAVSGDGAASICPRAARKEPGGDSALGPAAATPALSCVRTAVRGSTFVTRHARRVHFAARVRCHAWHEGVAAADERRSCGRVGPLPSSALLPCGRHATPHCSARGTPGSPPPFPPTHTSPMPCLSLRITSQSIYLSLQVHWDTCTPR